MPALPCALFVQRAAILLSHAPPPPSHPPASGRPVRSWMGWNGHVSVNPYTGLQFFNLKFKGQRVVYELALKVSWAGQHWARACLGLSARDAPACMCLPTQHATR